MNYIKRYITITSLLLCFAITKSCSQAPTGSSVVGVFVGNSPCGYFPRPMLNIPSNANCERIEWELTLYEDQKTHAPTSYILYNTYGIAQQGARGFVDGGTKTAMEGKWKIVKGTKTNPAAVVYQLNPGNPKTSISFLKLDDNLLHLLYSDQTLMIGNDSWSYTLNKVRNQ